MLTAAVVGLGKVGSRFDEENRGAVWSHVGAYLNLSNEYRLVAAADVLLDNRQRFAQRCPDVPVFENVARILENERPDVFSICTPSDGRGDIVDEILDHYTPKVIICEKPLEIDEARRGRIVARCDKAGTKLIVNYNRRYDRVYQKVRQLVDERAIGKLTSATIISPNRLWSIGSHALNLLFFFADDCPRNWKALLAPALEEEGEPAADIFAEFPSGVVGRCITAGFKDMMVFEVDLVGERGRIRVVGNGTRASLQLFEASQRYQGYRELAEAECVAEQHLGDSTFIALLKNAAECAAGRGTIMSTGQHALQSEGILGDVVRLGAPK